MRIWSIAALVLVFGTGAVRAQENDFSFDENEPYIIDVFYPKLFWTPREGLGGGLHYALINDLDFMEYGVNPASYRASLAFNGHLTTSGSRYASLVLAAPAFVANWRFYGGLYGLRDNRDNYFGLGNQSTFDKSLVTDAQPNFYRASRDLIRFRGEAQRRFGNVRLLAGFNYDRARIPALSGPSVFTNDVTAGNITTGAFETDFTTRFGILFDTRDSEVAPRNGVFLEGFFGVADPGLLGDADYTRTTVSLRGYIAAGELLSFAGRVMGQSMGGNPTPYSYYLIEESDRTYDGFGSERSHRAIRHNRLLGPDKLLFNADVRYILFGAPGLYYITTIGFLDAARVFDQGQFSMTFSDLMVGGGTGLMLHIGARLVVGGTLGVGPDGVVGNFHTQWPF